MPPLNSAGQLQPVDLLRLRDQLRQAFLPAALEELLRSVNRRADNYRSPADAYPAALLRIVDAANSELWWRDLLAAARRARPGFAPLDEFADEFALAPQLVENTAAGSAPLAYRQLEARVRPTLPLFDIAVWRTRMAEVEARVCRIEFPAGRARGTGFLVGPDVVISNHHVLRGVLAGEVPATEVVLRFDYKTRADGLSVDAGRVYSLAADWCIEASPPSVCDEQVDESCVPAADELDFVLLRLTGAPGHERLVGTDPAAPTRGWIKLPPATAMPDLGSYKPLLIVQHPDGAPLKIALDSDSILGVSGGGTRLRYRTNTEAGSSGSPCFDFDWNWLALHHSGDPMYPRPGEPARYNQGILVSAIVALLRQRNRLDVLGA